MYHLTPSCAFSTLWHYELVSLHSPKFASPFANATQITPEQTSRASSGASRARVLVASEAKSANISYADPGIAEINYGRTEEAQSLIAVECLRMGRSFPGTFEREWTAR